MFPIQNGPFYSLSDDGNTLYVSVFFQPDLNFSLSLGTVMPIGNFLDVEIIVNVGTAHNPSGFCMLPVFIYPYSILNFDHILINITNNGTNLSSGPAKDSTGTTIGLPPKIHVEQGNNVYSLIESIVHFQYGINSILHDLTESLSKNGHSAKLQKEFFEAAKHLQKSIETLKSMTAILK